MCCGACTVGRHNCVFPCHLLGYTCDGQCSNLLFSGHLDLEGWFDLCAVQEPGHIRFRFADYLGNQGDVLLCLDNLESFLFEIGFGSYSFIKFSYTETLMKF